MMQSLILTIQATGWSENHPKEERKTSFAKGLFFLFFGHAKNTIVTRAGKAKKISKKIKKIFYALPAI